MAVTLEEATYLVVNSDVLRFILFLFVSKIKFNSAHNLTLTPWRIFPLRLVS
jgi:hypothetical protein